MEQGSSLNEDADISDFPEVNLSVPLKAFELHQIGTKVNVIGFVVEGC